MASRALSLDRNLTSQAVEALLDYTQKKRSAKEKVNCYHCNTLWRMPLTRRQCQKQLVDTVDPIMVMMAIKKIPEKQNYKPILM